MYILRWKAYEKAFTALNSDCIIQHHPVRFNSTIATLHSYNSKQHLGIWSTQSDTGLYTILYRLPLFYVIYKVTPHTRTSLIVTLPYICSLYLYFSMCFFLTIDFFLGFWWLFISCHPLPSHIFVALLPKVTKKFNLSLVW